MKRGRKLTAILAALSVAAASEIAVSVSAAEENSEPDWVKEYQTLLMNTRYDLEKIISGTEDSYVQDLAFCIDDMDGDGIPEAAVADNNNAHYNGVEIYTWQNGQGVDLGGFGSNGGCQICREQGIIRSESSGQGASTIDFWQIDHSNPSGIRRLAEFLSFWSEDEATYSFIDEGARKYDNLSEEEYNSKMQEYEDAGTFTAYCVPDSEGGNGFAASYPDWVGLQEMTDGSIHEQLSAYGGTDEDSEVLPPSEVLQSVNYNSTEENSVTASCEREDAVLTISGASFFETVYGLVTGDDLKNNPIVMYTGSLDYGDMTSWIPKAMLLALSPEVRSGQIEKIVLEGENSDGTEAYDFVTASGLVRDVVIEEINAVCNFSYDSQGRVTSAFFVTNYGEEDMSSTRIYYRYSDDGLMEIGTPDQGGAYYFPGNYLSDFCDLDQNGYPVRIGNPDYPDEPSDYLEYDEAGRISSFTGSPEYMDYAFPEDGTGSNDTTISYVYG